MGVFGHLAMLFTSVGDMIPFASPETAPIEYSRYVTPVSQLLQNVLMETRLRIAIQRDANHKFNIPETSCSIHPVSCSSLLHYRDTYCDAPTLD